MGTDYNMATAQVTTSDLSGQGADTIQNDTTKCDSAVTNQTNTVPPVHVQGSSNNIICWLGLVALAILTVAIFCYLRKIINKQNEELNKIVTTLKEYKKRLQKIEDESDNIQKKLNSLNAKGKETTSNGTISNQVVKSSVVSDNILKTSNTIVKYADFYMEENVPVVENRDLSADSQSYTFKITMKESAATATYTINLAKVSSIMQDVAAISDYVEGLQIIPNAKSIEVVEDGILSKSGNKWKIDRKMKVKLV